MEIQSLKKNNRLGRGLDSLLGPSPRTEIRVLSLDIEKVFPNKSQPRKHFEKTSLDGLSQSIKNHGVLQPLLVQSKGDGYEIIAGERRWRAATQAGLHKIPVIVKNPKPKESSLWALLENIQRKDLNPLEEARAYKIILQERGIGQEELSKALGFPRSSLANSLRLLQLDPKVQKYLETQQISFSQAKEILSLKNPKEQREAAERCIKGKLTVRSLVKIYKKRVPSKKQKSLPLWISKSISHVEQIFSRKIKIDFSSKQKGKLSFIFNSEEDLRDLLDKLWRIKK